MIDNGMVELDPHNLTSLPSQLHILRLEWQEQIDLVLQGLPSSHTLCQACTECMSPYQALAEMGKRSEGLVSNLCELAVSLLRCVEKQNQRYTALEIQHKQAVVEMQAYSQELQTLTHSHQLERRDSQEKAQQLEAIVQQLQNKHEECVQEWQTIECRIMQTQQASRQQQQRTNRQYQTIINQQYQDIQRLKADLHSAEVEISLLNKQISNIRAQLNLRSLVSSDSSPHKSETNLSFDDEYFPDNYEPPRFVVMPSQVLSDEISELGTSFQEQMKKMHPHSKSILTETEDSQALARNRSSHQELFKHSLYSNQLLKSRNQKLTKSTVILPEGNFFKKEATPIQPFTRAIHKIHNFLHSNIVSRRLKIKKP